MMVSSEGAQGTGSLEAGGPDGREGGRERVLKVNGSLAVSVSELPGWLELRRPQLVSRSPGQIPLPSLRALSLLSPSAVFTLLAGQRLHNCLLLLRWLWMGIGGELGCLGCQPTAP